MTTHITVKSDFRGPSAKLSQHIIKVLGMIMRKLKIKTPFVYVACWLLPTKSL